MSAPYNGNLVVDMENKPFQMPLFELPGQNGKKRTAVLCPFARHLSQTCENYTVGISIPFP